MKSYGGRSRLGVRIVVAVLMLDMTRAPALAAAMPPVTAKAAAPIDLTGNWVSIVNEDWRWRMLTPPKGDYTSVPLNEAGSGIADNWDQTLDGSCRAYGVGGLMRMPTRLRISWESTEVLKVETDSGLQVRRFFFTNPPQTAQKTLQGRSLAQWQLSTPAGDGWGFGEAASQPPGGSLRVTTTEFQRGWLRRNGVPYGESAQITEYYDTFSAPDGSQWFVVTTIVDDPEYLTAPFVTSSHFRREIGPTQWTPRPCKD